MADLGNFNSRSTKSGSSLPESIRLLLFEYMEMQMKKKRRTETFINIVQRQEKVNHVQSVDRFTCLPNNILSTILGFLPMKYACRTCLSSKKLINLLASIPNLHFGRERYDFAETNGAPVEFVERFLEKRDAPIKSFRVQVSFTMGTFDVGHWISLLQKIGVEDLELDIGGKWLRFDVLSSVTVYPFILEKYELPAELFSSETIRSLKLCDCIFRPPPTCTVWGLVEKLFLGKISLSDDIITSFLSQCVVLRVLTLYFCDGFKKIEILRRNSRLECLKLKYCCTAITLNAPNLPTLYYYCCDKLNLHLKASTYVTNLFYKQNVLSDHRRNGQNIKKYVLHKLPHVQSLSLTGLSIQSLATARVPKTIGMVYLGLRKLTLEINLNDPKELKVLSSWLRSCPILNELSIEIADQTYDFCYYPEESLAYMKSMHRNPQEYECLNTLEFICMNGFDSDSYSDRAELIKFFLANTPELKKMDLIGMYDMMLPYGEDVMNMPRASQDAIIKVTEWKTPF